MVYFIRSGKRGAIKIGWAKDVSKRLRILQTGSAEELSLIGAIPGGKRLERQIHERFAADRLTGEWFKPTAEVRRWARMAAVIDGRHPEEVDGEWLRDDIKADLRRHKLLLKGGQRNHAPR